MNRATSLICLAILTIFSAFVLAGCGNIAGMSSSSGMTGGSNAIQTSFSISDTPPANVTVLRFQIQLTAASLQPMGSGPAVSLLNSPQVVELTRLQSESALLANPSVPGNTYTSLSATFANPQMTILNRSNTTYNVGGQSCAPGAVCTFNPTLNKATVTDESAPFPIMLSGNSPVAFVLHFNVNASVQGDLSVSPTINLKELPPLPGNVLAQFHVTGRITAVNSPNFTLQTGFGAVTLNIATTSSTTYDFDSACTADNFGCLTVGEVVRVGVSGMPGGALDAFNVELLAPVGMPALEGTVIAVNTAQNQIQVALGDFQDDPTARLAAASFAFGRMLTINISGSTKFSVDTDGIILPPIAPALSFAGISDTMIGQTVAVQPSPTAISVTASTNPVAFQILFSASSVRLESSEVTATVASTNPSSAPSSFTLNGLPPLFTGETPAVTEIKVDTVTGTSFQNVSGVSGLADGNTVSVGGLLFNTGTTPTLLAKRVLLH